MSKFRFTLLTITVMVVTLATTAVEMDAADGPKLMVPEKIMDMGRVAQGEVLNVDFAVVNEGDETLEIKAVRPTCGCTVADFDREIAPGKTGYIKAKLDTRDFSGPISKSILIMTTPSNTSPWNRRSRSWLTKKRRISKSTPSRLRCRSSSLPSVWFPPTNCWPESHRNSTKSR